MGVFGGKEKKSRQKLRLRIRKIGFHRFSIHRNRYGSRVYPIRGGLASRWQVVTVSVFTYGKKTIIRVFSDNTITAMV